MKHLILFLFVSAFLINPAFAQGDWDLRRTVEYAVANNISVKQANLSSLQAELDFRQNSFGRYPNASFNNNWGLSFGRREIPRPVYLKIPIRCIPVLDLILQFPFLIFTQYEIPSQPIDMNWKDLKHQKKKPGMTFP